MSGACCLGGACQQQSATVCSRFGGVFYDGISCQHVDCETGQLKGACCIDGDCVDFLTEQECLFQQGTYQGNVTNCQIVQCDEPPLPDGCIESKPDRAPARGALPWSPDLCQVTAFVPGRRPTEHIPQPGEERDGETFDPGDFETVSAHPARIMDVNILTEPEPCSPHYGYMTIRDNGIAQAAACGRPNFQLDSTRQLYAGDVYVTRGLDSMGLVEPGDALFLMATRAPDYAEAMYRSHQNLCGEKR